MTHPITPPPELVQQWQKRFEQGADIFQLFTNIFQAGADQELEACCEWLDKEGWSGESRQLRAARRPKPPSLKEQAIAVLEDAELDAAHYNILLRALEQLDD
jgi:hypothetical protein